MVKLTPELINSSMQFINPCRDRELDLRGTFPQRICLKLLKKPLFEVMFYNYTLISFHISGYKIPQIENMGATLDQFDTIDFSENDLRKLDNFPYLQRLKCLLLNNNRIVYVLFCNATFALCPIVCHSIYITSYCIS